MAKFSDGAHTDDRRGPGHCRRLRHDHHRLRDAESYRGAHGGQRSRPNPPARRPRRAEAAGEVPAQPPDTGRRPRRTPTNAWYWKSEVKGRAGGPLKGKRVALKDNICLAGVPMMNGATVLEGYVPDIDATVVTRILDAGGTIVGKAANTYLCFDGSAAPPPATGMVENPAQEGLHLGRLVGRQRRAGRHRRGRHGARRRPGRLDPHARMLVRHLRAQADARAGSPTPGSSPSSTDPGPHRPDGSAR